MNVSELNDIYKTLVVMSQDTDIDAEKLKETKSKLLNEITKELDDNGRILHMKEKQ